MYIIIGENFSTEHRAIEGVSQLPKNPTREGNFSAPPKKYQTEGDIGGYPIPQYRKKIFQIPKYRVENTRNTNTQFMIGHVFLKLYPSRVFVYLKRVCY